MPLTLPPPGPETAHARQPRWPRRPLPSGRSRNMIGFRRTPHAVAHLGRPPNAPAAGVNLDRRLDHRRGRGRARSAANDELGPVPSRSSVFRSLLRLCSRPGRLASSTSSQPGCRRGTGKASPPRRGCWCTPSLRWPPSSDPPALATAGQAQMSEQLNPSICMEFLPITRKKKPIVRCNP